MEEKHGRERRFAFSEEVAGLAPGDQWMVGMFLELGERVLDQVDHLPPAVLNACPPQSYLSPARLVLHLVGTDLRMLGLLGTPVADPGYASVVARTTSGDFTTLETGGIDSVALLAAHLPVRRRELLDRCGGPLGLDQRVDHPSFATARAVVGHLIWHWSFHSGHLGAVTLELGHEYHWRSSLLAR